MPPGGGTSLLDLLRITPDGATQVRGRHLREDGEDMSPLDNEVPELR